MELLAYAEAVRALGLAAHQAGLTTPCCYVASPQCAARSLRRREGSVVVTIPSVIERDDQSIRDDLVAGMLAANGLPADDPLREQLLALLREDEP